MGRLAVIGVLYRRPALYDTILSAIECQSRKPDELWLMCEDPADIEAIGFRSLRTSFPTYVRQVSVPPNVVPPSACINAALDETQADYITYLTDDSLPHPDKYRRMAEALEAGAQAVYCGQGFDKARSPEEWLERITRPSSFRHTSGPSDNPFCRIDHTQVAHVRTEDRWPLSISELKWSDGAFFRSLVARVGPLQPIPDVLDYTCQLPDGISARS
jgi:hypothetical protein